MNNRISEGTESAARLLRLPVRQMTDDPYLLHRTHRVDTHDLGVDDGVSVGGCCSHFCEEGRSCPQRVEYAGNEPRDYFSIAIIAVLLLSIASIVFSPEIAEVLYRMDVK